MICAAWTVLARWRSHWTWLVGGLAVALALTLLLAAFDWRLAWPRVCEVVGCSAVGWADVASWKLDQASGCESRPGNRPRAR
jgi:hypothetical protein